MAMELGFQGAIMHTEGRQALAAAEVMKN